MRNLLVRSVPVYAGARVVEHVTEREAMRRIRKGVAAMRGDGIVRVKPAAVALWSSVSDGFVMNGRSVNRAIAAAGCS